MAHESRVPTEKCHCAPAGLSTLTKQNFAVRDAFMALPRSFSARQLPSLLSEVAHERKASAMTWRYGVYIYGFSLVCFLRTQWSLTRAFATRDLANKSWLAKTRETFKLSDLQLLEANLQAREYQCERLVLDAATGASLFQLSGAHFQEALSNDTLPSSMKRCEWIASILAFGASTEQLLANIRSDASFEEHDWETNACWTLDYLRMNELGSVRAKSANYTSKSLLSCVSQAIAIPAALRPAAATDRLRVVDTGKDLFLVRVLKEMKDNSALAFIKKWNQRPFPYSSAINPSVADILTALVLDLVEQQCGKQAHQIKLLDPTCGSGTFLAYALARGANGQGWDTNPACVDGSQRNIQFVLDNNHDVHYKISLRDATQLLASEKADENSHFDCAIANLPWGQNSILYYNENVRILELLPSSLRPRAPCAFISKDDELQREMGRLGYEILGDAHIPPVNFVLPTSKKAKGKTDASAQIERSTTCVVTVALAPE